MSNDIVPARSMLPAAAKQRSTPEEVIAILAPMFAIFQVKAEKEVQRLYVQHLLDIPPDRLRVAVETCIQSCEFLPTVAHIRKAYLVQTGEPGPRNDLTQEQIAARRNISNMQLYRDPEDTPAGRRERLRRTEKWGNRYGH